MNVPVTHETIEEISDEQRSQNDNRKFISEMQLPKVDTDMSRQSVANKNKVGSLPSDKWNLGAMMRGVTTIKSFRETDSP